MSIYKCPNCGGEVDVKEVLTYPSTTCYKCRSCNYHHDERHKIDDEIIIAPLN